MVRMSPAPLARVVMVAVLLPASVLSYRSGAPATVCESFEPGKKTEGNYPPKLLDDNKEM